MRLDRPVKATRRTPVDIGENDDANRTAGATGQVHRGPNRPGKAAALEETAARMRSQRWRTAKRGAGRTGRSPAAKAGRTSGRRAASVH